MRSVVAAATRRRNAHGDGRVRADNGDILYTKFSSILLEQFPRPGVGQRVEFSRLQQSGDPRVFAIGVVILDSKGRPSISVSDDNT
jgi:hypothetical protein